MAVNRDGDDGGPVDALILTAADHSVVADVIENSVVVTGNNVNLGMDKKRG